MSLTEQQRERTAQELAANLELAGLSIEQVCAALRFNQRQARATLAVRGVDPADVWLLRDHLERAVLDAGRTPVSFTVLTEAARPAAGRWFGVQPKPGRPG